MTGIVGVNRDILGTGLGARPIANTDVFCFGPPDWEGALPDNLFHPSRVLRGVHAGVRVVLPRVPRGRVREVGGGEAAARGRERSLEGWQGQQERQEGSAWLGWVLAARGVAAASAEQWAVVDTCAGQPGLRRRRRMTRTRVGVCSCAVRP